MWKNCCSSRMVWIWTLVVGLLFGGVLLLAFWGIPRIILSQIHAQTRLKEGTEQWDRFVELPFPLNYTLRFFNVTNQGEVINNTAVPNLVETEAYTYKMTLKKTEIRFDDPDEDSVTYRRSFHFEFDNSGTTKATDSVTIINPLLMVSLQITTPIQRLALAGCMDRILKPSGLHTIFITKTVDDLLFHGTRFAFANATDLGVACELVRQRMITIANGIRVIEHVNETYPDYLRLILFNYKTDYYLKESPDGIYTVNRGIDDMSALGTIMRWNGKTRITTYGHSQSTNNDTCQVLKGTDSTIYSPNLKSGQDLTIYNTDICRTVRVKHVSSDESYSGITAFRYETSDNLFRPATVNAEKDCYCMKATKDTKGNDNCYLDGVFDFKPCIGAPILLSQPHFLHADQKYVDGVIGLSPNKSKHGIYLLLEPNTGTPLKGMKRVQLNSVLKKQPLLHFITPKTMYEGIIPILWLEEGFSLPEKYVNQLNDQYFSKVKIADGVKYGLVASFASLFAACIFLVWRKEYFKNKNN